MLMETKEQIKIDWMSVSPRVTLLVMETADRFGITPTEAIKRILAEKCDDDVSPQRHIVREKSDRSPRGKKPTKAA